MTNREKLDNVLNNINEQGMELLVYLFGDMDKKERYNKRTSLERIAELDELQRQKDEELERTHKEDRLNHAEAEYDRQEASKAALMGREKKFFDTIEDAKKNIPDRYWFSHNEMLLLASVYNNNFINTSMDIFAYGFLKGQRAERAKSKKKLGNQGNKQEKVVVNL